MKNNEQPQHTQNKKPQDAEQIDVYGDMRKIGLSSDQCQEVSEYIERMFVAKSNRTEKAVNEYDENKRKADMHDELVKELRKMYDLVLRISEVHKTGLSKNLKVEQLLKQAEQK